MRCLCHDASLRVSSLASAGLIVAVIAMALLVSVGAASFSTKDRQCSSLVVRTDKDVYAIGEAVNVSVDYVHLLPGCFEFMIAHDYVIKFEILNSSNITQYSYSNATAGNLVIHVSWKPAEEGNYTVKASSWLRLAGDESAVKQMEDSVVFRVQGQPEGSALLASEFDLATVGTLTIAAVTLVLALTRHRRRKSLDM